MKVSLLGTGQVARALARGFAARGDRVAFGSRDPRSPQALAAAASVPGTEAAGFADAARAGETIVLATNWGGTRAALEQAGPAHFAGKLVIDVTNPLDVSSGKPRLALGFPQSGGATVQSLLPGAKVVKAFNIITSTRMVNPRFDDGAPDIFIAGDDAAAKAEVTAIAKAFGWRGAIDMGGIGQSYLLEAIAMTWIDYGIARNHWTHGFSLLGAQAG